MARTRTHRWCRLAVIPAAAFMVYAQAATQSAVAAESPNPTAAQSRAAATSPRDHERQLNQRLASKLIGMDVRNGKGEDIGEIADLVVDMNTGAVRYAVLSFDPGILSAEKLVAVPPKQLHMAADGHEAVFRVDKAQLERATIARADWTARFFTDEDKVVRLDKAWNITQPTRGASAHRASDLIGKDVNDRSGKDIGDLKDLVIDTATNKVHYAILAFDPSWRTAEKNYAFPLKSFSLTGDKDELVLDVDRAKVQAMKGFDDARLSRLNDRDWVTGLNRRMADMTSGTVGAAATGTAKASALFRELDGNRDGWLSRDEARDDRVHGDWSALDTNDDGRVSRQEFNVAHGDTAGR